MCCDINMSKLILLWQKVEMKKLGPGTTPDAIYVSSKPLLLIEPQAPFPALVSSLWQK
jgi:hypothetical protein